MKPSLFACALTTLFLGLTPVRADEAEEAGQRLLEGLDKGYDARLEGSTTLGIYMAGKSLGTIQTSVERAPEGSGAVYLQKMEMKLAVGPSKVHNQGEALLDARLALVSSTQTEREEQGGQVKEVKKVTRREGDGFVREQTTGAETVTFRAPGGSEDHDESLIVLLRLAGNQPGKYAFRGLEWPKAAGAEPAWQALTLDVAAAAETEHRGAKLQAHQIKALKGDDEEMQLVVTVEGKLLAMLPGGRPIKMIAGTPEECAQDLPRPDKPAAAGVSDVMEAVEIYFRVLSGERPMDEIDRVMDWKAIQDQAAQDNPDVNTVTPEQFGELTKAEIKQHVPAIQPEQVGLVMQLLQSKVEGDEAEVQLPGKEEKFRLRKQADGTWRIYVIPR